MLLSVNDFLPGYLFAVVVIKCFMIGVNVWWVYLAPQNIPRAISVLTLGNKVISYRIWAQDLWTLTGPDVGVLWHNPSQNTVCTYDNHTLSVSGFRCWQLQVPLRGRRGGSGRAWKPVTLQRTPFWSCSAAIPLFPAGTGYRVLFTCCTASLKKLSPGSFFQLDNDNGTFMECFWRLEALYNLMKEKYGMRKYTHRETDLMA